MISKYLLPSTGKLYSGSSGFTLIEIMVVVVIISILAGLAVDGSRGYIIRANDTTRANNAKAIADKLELYYRANPLAAGNTYPSASSSYADLVSAIGDRAIIDAPGVSGQTITIAKAGWTVSQAGDGYLYVAQNVDGSVCSDAPCPRFTLYFFNQIRNQFLSINSMRQQ